MCSYLQQFHRPRENAEGASTESHDSGINADINFNANRDEHSLRSRLQDASLQPITSPAARTSAPTIAPAPHPPRPSSRSDACMSNVDTNVSNRVHPPGRFFASNHDLQQQFIGESTCSAFSDRILQCLDPGAVATPLSTNCQYVRHTTFFRQMSSVACCKFPDRIRATLLVRVAIRFIGQDYHMFMQQDFFQHLEKMYGSTQALERQNDSVWVCKFFVILALGELYSTTLTAAKEASASTVAGTGYFLTAVELLQDVFEEPSIEQIETLLLFVSSSYSLFLSLLVPPQTLSGPVNC
jgi:hypothetical protein